MARTNAKGKGKSSRQSDREPEAEAEEQATVDEDEQDMDVETMNQTELDTSVYNPFQNKDEKMQVRKDLRQRIEEASTILRNSTEVLTNQLAECVEGLDTTFIDSVRAPAEATLDAKVLRLHAETGAMKARNMKIDANAFDIDEFIARLGKIMRKKGPPGGEDSEDSDEEDERPRGKMEWEKMGREVLKISRRAPVIDVMYGPLEIQQKKRKVTQRQKIVKDESQRVAPEQLQNEDVEQADNETTKNVQQMYKVLEAKGGQAGVNVFEFFVNPKSFGQSVENLFQLAFLIRDGLACLETHDDDGNELEYPIVFACEQSTTNDKAASVTKRQLVIPFDESMWEDAKETFDLEGKEPIVPHRDEQSGTRLKGKWVG